MITRIGIVAGDIWHLLEEKKAVDLSTMVTETEWSREMLLMGLGWLDREGHITLKEVSGDYVASLRVKPEVAGEK